MKYILSALLMVGLVFAPTTLIVETAIMDDGVANSSPGSDLRQATMIDSCCLHSLIHVNHECISYNQIADAMCAVNRNYNPTGILNVHSAPGDLSFWVHDYAVYMADFGNGCCPTAIAGTQGPYISFPWFVDGPAWGGAGAQYCSGGWFSSFWDSPVDLGPGDQKVFRVIGKESPDSNLCFILYSTDPWGLQYRTYNDSLTTLLASGWLTDTTESYYFWGWDCNLTAGIAYIYYVNHYMLDSMSIFYKTTTDGVNWSNEQGYNIVWPTPYAHNEIGLIWGCQAAITDSGNPLLVFAIMNADDTNYPQEGKVFVSHTEGQPCVEVSEPAELKNFYSTIATGGNMVAVTYMVPRTAQQDSATFHDVWINWSYDNGRTWDIPENLTSWSTLRSQIPQLAKRLDIVRERAYILYARVRLPSEDMDFVWAYNNADCVSTYNMILYASVPGVEEQRTEILGEMLLKLTPNPATNRITISYTLPKKCNISLKLFSVDGRLVKMIEDGYRSAGIYTADLKTNELTSGTYFLVLDTEVGKQTRSIVVVH